MRVDMSKAKQEFVEIDGAKYNLRSMPFSRFRMPETDEDGNPILTMETAWVLFDGCLVGWEGLEDTDGKPVPFNRKNRKYIFDYIEDVREPVLKRIVELNGHVENEVKN